MLFVARGPEQDADAEIEAVQDDVHEDRKGNDAGPEESEV